jgi:predicted RNase H-like HicB family nuclease
MRTYGVIYEQADDGSWSACAADLPVFTVGDTPEEAERGIREAIALYLDVLARTGEPIPETRSVVGHVTV